MGKTKCDRPINYFDNCNEFKCGHYRDCIQIRQEDIYFALQTKEYKEQLQKEKKEESLYDTMKGHRDGFSS